MAVPTLKQIIDILEDVAPAHDAEEWDNTGLQVGKLSQRIKKIYVALDPTLHAVKKAVSRNAQLLLTHHPLIFRPISRLNPDTYPGNVIREALDGGIAILAAHTNLDVAENGINEMLAQLLELKGIEILQRIPMRNPQATSVGLGRIGILPKAVRLATLSQKVKKVFNVEKVMIVGHRNRKIRKVAVVGGSGGGMLETASIRKADVLITGDIGHHHALEAKSLGIALIDGGHFHTEKTALARFTKLLKKKFAEIEWNVTLEIYTGEKNPMQYV